MEVPQARDLFCECLDAEQRAELKTITAANVQRQYLVSRVLVRAALKWWAGQAAEMWRLAAEANGRPYIVVPPGALVAPVVSISHSGNTVLCALASHGPVGVDVECVRTRDIDGLAREVLTDEERAQLARSTEPHRLFYRFWTLKEACVKALGTGLATPLHDISFDIIESRIRTHSKWLNADAYFLGFEVDPDTIAAIALLSSPRCDMTFHRLSAIDTLVAVNLNVFAATPAS